MHIEKPVLWSSFLSQVQGVGKVRANQYYRVVIPFRVARDMGLTEEFYIEGYSQVAPMDINERLLLPMISDVILLSNVLGKGLTSNCKEIRKLKPTVDPDSLRRVYPPVVVFDQDDLTRYVSVFNDAYWNLGTLSPTGEKLVTGDSVRVKNADGDEVVLWQDGVCVRCEHGSCGPGLHIPFDVERNNETLKQIEQLALSAHGGMFPTKYLAEHYAKLGMKNTYVFPNSIYFKDYPSIDLADHPDEVRVLWQGGSSHFEDWWQYRGVLGRVAAKYPRVKFILWGQPYGWLIREIPEAQRTFLDWVDHSAYVSRLNTIGHDINLCPLLDNKFNNAKSAIKWYESSAISRPAATLASNVPPYGDEIVDDETGLLANLPEEFEAKLCLLIENQTLRKELAANAKAWVKEHRDAEKTVPAMLEWMLSLRAQYDEEEAVAQG